MLFYLLLKLLVLLMFGSLMLCMGLLLGVKRCMCDFMFLR